MTNNVFPLYENAEKEVAASIERADGSLAEARLYDMLRQQLPKDWSFLWGLQLGVHEYDFLVLVPGWGIVNVECKGYGYEHLPTHKFNWKNKITGKTELKDVMGQAAGAAKYYNEFLKKYLLGIGSHWGLMGYCVIFPLEEYEGVDFSGVPIYRASDCDPQKKGLKKIILESLSQAKSILKERFGIDKPALLSLENSTKVWDFWMQNNSETQYTRAYVKIDLQAFKDSMETMLTATQRFVMQEIKNSTERHILVEGTAGTGKSILAKFLAESLEGENLYVCFNKLLAQYTKLTFPDGTNTTISHFHKLDEILLGEKLEIEKDDGESDAAYWERFDKEMLTLARKLPPTERRNFDNIIVDEAQDLTETQIRFLLRFCKTKGKFLLFADSEQTLYPNRITMERLEKLFPGIKSQSLPTNLRNTKHIAKYCQDLMPDDSALSKTIALLYGPEIVREKIKKEDINSFLRNKILSIYNPGDIAVLSPLRDLLLNVNSASGVTFCGPDNSSNKTEKNLVAWLDGKYAWKSTTSSFKGLEAMAIVHLVPVGYSQNSQLYVGGSRAIRHLFIVEVE